MKRSFEAITSMIVAICLIATMAAFNFASKTAKAAEKVQIRVVSSFTGDDPWTKPFLEACKEFMTKNPNIEIIDEATPTAGEALRTKVKTDFASGDEPDVAYFFNGVDTQPLLESGKLACWDDFFKQDPSWAKTFSQLAVKSTRYNGRLYALPFIGYFEGLLVNKDLFKKFGVKIPANYNELLTAITKFNSDGIIPIANSFVDPRYLLEHSILSVGGPKGHAVPYDASWEKGLNIIKELYEKKAFPKDSLNLTDEQAVTLFRTKKAAMIVNGSWAVGSCPDVKNTIVTYFPLLKGAKADQRDIIAGCGSGWYMSKDKNLSKNGAPLKFIKYITSSEVMAKFISYGGVPQIKCNSKNVKFSTKSGWNMEANAHSLNNPIDSFLNPDAFNELNKGIAYIVTGKKTAKQVLDSSKKLNIR